MIRKRNYFLLIVIYFSFLCFLPSFAQTNKGTLTITWNPNVESDLAGYRIYYGFQSRIYVHNIDVGKHTEWTITDLDSDKKYFFALTAYDIAGNESPFSKEVSAFPDTIQDFESTVPNVIILYQNYPNPFNPTTIIPFRLYEDDYITLRILNPKGQIVKTLYQGEKKAGFYKINWNGKDEFGKEISSGVYFIHLQSKFYQLTKTTVLFR